MYFHIILLLYPNARQCQLAVIGLGTTTTTTKELGSKKHRFLRIYDGFGSLFLVWSRRDVVAKSQHFIRQQFSRALFFVGINNT